MGRFGRRLDSRPGHCLPRHVAGPRSRRHARHLGQALHHPGAGGDGRRPGLPHVRSGTSARRRRGYRHHLRAGAGKPPRRGNRPPPLPAERRLAQRPDARQGCLHAARFHHRRPADGRPGLAHADGEPRRRPLDFAAGFQHRHAEAGGARSRRLCPRAQPVQDRHRQVRGHPGTAGAHGRQSVPLRRRPRHDRRRHRPRREAFGRLRHRQVPRHRARAAVDERRHGHPRRQGHLPRPLEFPRPRLPAGADRHHRRRRQHPHAQPDHLRPGRRALPSLCAGGNAGRAERRPEGFRQGPVCAHRTHLQQRLACLPHRHHRLALRQGAGQRGARDAPLLPAADALLLRLRLPRRHLDARHGRRPQAQGEALGAHGRHPLPDVPVLGGAQALRG